MIHCADFGGSSVGHQAVAQQRQFAELNVLPKQIQVDQTLAIAGEEELPSVATLRHMVRYIYDYDTQKARYPRQGIRKRPVCPPVSPGG